MNNYIKRLIFIITNDTSPLSLKRWSSIRCRPSFYDFTDNHSAF